MANLALALGKTLAEISELSEAEIEFWRVFFDLYPFDDLHRYHRPAAKIYSASMKDPEAAFTAALDHLQPKPKKPVRKLRPARVIKGKKP